MSKTATYQLIEHTVGDLEQYVKAARDEGKSWDDISHQIREATGITVSRETIRLWFVEQAIA